MRLNLGFVLVGLYSFPAHALPYCLSLLRGKHSLKLAYPFRGLFNLSVALGNIVGKPVSFAFGFFCGTDRASQLVKKRCRKCLLEPIPLFG